jgi:hypothetical protein
MHPAVALLEHQQALNCIARQARAAELALLPHLERELASMRRNKSKGGQEHRCS